MELLMDFVSNNFVWLIGAAVVAILAILGYYAEKNHYLEDSNKDLEEDNVPKNNKEDVTSINNEPVTTEDEMSNDFVDENDKDLVAANAEEVVSTDNEPVTTEDEMSNDFVDKNDKDLIAASQKDLENDPKNSNYEPSLVAEEEFPFDESVSSELETEDASLPMADSNNEELVANENDLNSMDTPVGQSDNSNLAELEDESYKDLENIEDFNSSNEIKENEEPVQAEDIQFELEEDNELDTDLEENEIGKTRDLKEIKEELNKIVFKTSVDQKYRDDVEEDIQELNDVNDDLAKIENS